MSWFKVTRNTRLNKKRYLKGEAYDLDAATAKLSDNFVPCDAPPVAAQATKSAAKPADAKPEAPATKKS